MEFRFTTAGAEIPRLLQSFERKGRFSEMMKRIPVHLMAAKVGIAGCGGVCA
jgi:glucokinase